MPVGTATNVRETATKTTPRVAELTYIEPDPATAEYRHALSGGTLDVVKMAANCAKGLSRFKLSNVKKDEPRTVEQRYQAGEISTKTFIHLKMSETKFPLVGNGGSAK